MKSKNYILLCIIYLCTILSVIYFCLIYNNSNSSIIDSDIGNLVIDVTGKNYEELYNNIDNYTKEDHDYVIYVSSYKKRDMKTFENMLKDVISSNNLKNRILYINVDELKKYNYINNLLGDFSYENKLNKSDLPVFISFHNGKIVDVTSVYNFSYEELCSYLEDNYD